MARKKAPEEHENHERWLVSYADFITLLFAFFVVMYSISSVNEGKYRVLSDSLVSAFHSSPKSLQPIQIGALSKAPVTSTTQVDTKNPALVKLPKMFISQNKNIDGQVRDPLQDEQYKEGDDLVVLKKIADDVKDALASLVDQGLITVKQGALWVEIEIKNSVLYTSGSARLQEQAMPVLKKVAKVLSESENAIRVEGFTDNLSISTVVYPSNWELSAARASSVVRLFVKHGITPNRMVAQGYGKYRPIADNNTPEGRAQNRRVVIVVLADKLVEKLLNEYNLTAGEEATLSDPHDADIPEQAVDHLPDESLMASAEDIKQLNNDKPAELPGRYENKTAISKDNESQQRTHTKVPAAAPHGMILPGIHIINPLVLAPFRLALPIQMRSTSNLTDKGASYPSEPEITIGSGDTVTEITRFK